MNFSLLDAVVARLVLVIRDLLTGVSVLIDLMVAVLVFNPLLLVNSMVPGHLGAWVLLILTLLGHIQRELHKPVLLHRHPELLTLVLSQPEMLLESL